MSRLNPGAPAPKRKRGGSTAAAPPEAELEILACLHDRGEMDARSVGALLRASRPLAHSSVVTLLGRLEAKGLVARRPAPVGKAFLYRATGGSARVLDTVLRRLVSRVFGGDRLSVVSTLFRSMPATEAEIAALRDLVEEPPRAAKGEEAMSLAGEWTLHLIHFTAQGSVAAALLLGAAAAIPRANPGFRGVLLGIALLKFVVPPMLPFPTGLFSCFGAAPRGFFDPRWSAAFGAIAALHFTGAAASFVRLALERRRIRRVCLSSAAVDVRGFADLARKAGLPRPPEIRVSSEVPVPCAIGGRRPTILLPERVIEGVSGASLDLVLEHELVHLRRRDPLMEAAESLVASLWWFNPLVRVLVERRRALREERCDEEVLRSRSGRGFEYSLALLSVASLAAGKRSPGTVAATGSRWHLERRLRRIAESQPGSSGRIRCALAIAVAVFLVLPGVQPRAARSDVPAPTFSRR